MKTCSDEHEDEKFITFNPEHLLYVWTTLLGYYFFLSSSVGTWFSSSLIAEDVLYVILSILFRLLFILFFVHYKRFLQPDVCRGNNRSWGRCEPMRTLKVAVKTVKLRSKRVGTKTWKTKKKEKTEGPERRIEDVPRQQKDIFKWKTNGRGRVSPPK